MTKDNQHPLKQDPPSSRCGICLEYPTEIQDKNELLTFRHVVNDDDNGNNGKVHEHWFCRGCLTQYFVQCENDRKQAPLPCPHPGCTNKFQRDFIDRILDRPYTPKVWYVAPKPEPTTSQSMAGVIVAGSPGIVTGQADANHDDTKKTDDCTCTTKSDSEEGNHDTKSSLATVIPSTPKDPTGDNEFREWLDDIEHMKCGNCSAIILQDEGCSAMQCLCGWQFCWTCKLPIPDSGDDEDDFDYDQFCACRHDPDEFYDNIRRNEGYSKRPEVATETDFDDMKAFFERHKDSSVDDDDNDDDGDSIDEDENRRACDQLRTPG